MTPERIIQDLQNVNDAYLLETKSPVPTKKRALRPGRIALIAACLCALLAVGAAAAEVMELLPISTYVREDGKVVSIYQTETNTHTVPLDRLSEEALAFSASQMSLPATRICDSWDDAEKFLGLEVADLIAPNGLTPAKISVQTGGRSEICYHCAVIFTGRCDAPSFVDLRAAYDLDGVRISVNAGIATDSSQIRPGTSSHYFVADSSAEVTGWVTPYGITAMAVRHPDTSLFSGYFVLNDISFRFTASGAGSPEQTLSALMKLMNSFR